VPAGLTALLTYVTLSPPLSTTVPPYLYPGSLIRDIAGEWVLKLSWGTVVVFHLLESIYTVTLVKKHRTPFMVGVSGACTLMTWFSLLFLGHVRSRNHSVWLPRLDGAQEERPSRQDRFDSQGQIVSLSSWPRCTLSIQDAYVIGVSLTTPKSNDFGVDSACHCPYLISEANGITCPVASSLGRHPLRDASNIAPCHHHVLPPHRVSGQVDRYPGAFYSAGLPKRRRSEHCQSSAKCRQDSVPPILMAPRSD